MMMFGSHLVNLSILGLICLIVFGFIITLKQEVSVLEKDGYTSSYPSFVATWVVDGGGGVIRPGL